MENLKSSFCAAAASSIGKITFSDSVIDWPSSEYSTVGRVVLFGVMLVFNSLMMIYYVAALQRYSALKATVINFGLNFVFSSVIGWSVFGETVSASFLLGLVVMVVGVGLCKGKE